MTERLRVATLNRPDWDGEPDHPCFVAIRTGTDTHRPSEGDVP